VCPLVSTPFSIEWCAECSFVAQWSQREECDRRDMRNGRFVSKHYPSFQSDSLKGTPASRRPDEGPSITKSAAEKWLTCDYPGSGYDIRTATLSTALSFSSPYQAGSQLTMLPTVSVCSRCSVGSASSYTWFWHVSRDVPVNQTFYAIGLSCSGKQWKGTACIYVR